MAKKTKSRKPSKAKRISMLWDKCWEQMSLFTRLKWADAQGWVTCVSCGGRRPYTKMNAGHFKHGVLDFDEMNINPQDVHCNKFLHGNLINYYNFLLLKYGKDKLEDLIKRADKKPKHKYTEEELIKLLPELKEKVIKAKNGEYNVI
jgi:hypothetical protein